jgi:diaminopimelate decarboxylase
MNAPYALHADLVGPTCIPSVIGSDRALPELAEDDIVAILDAGMYAEAIANQFNATPRPASVLVNAGEATLVKRRETIADLFARHIVPVRLRVS